MADWFPMPRILLVPFCAVLLSGLAVQPAAAQLTKGDTAAVLVQAARRLAAEGERDLAADLLRHVIRWYGDTPLAAEAASLLDNTDRARLAGSGRIEFIVTNTLIGAWLGVAVPAAFGAESSPPFGAGLLLGPTTGLATSLAFSRDHPISSGQAGAYRLGFVWGSWQGVGWRAVLDLGETTSCFPDGGGGEFCVTETSDKAPWVAVLLGGITGLGAGSVLAGRNIPAGDAALVNDAALWGTWFGLVAGVLAGAENDALLTWGLLGGNALLLAGIPTARAWRPSVGEVRFISIVGIAGGLAGLGIALISEIDDTKTAIALPAMGSMAGLVIGAAVTSGRARRSSGGVRDAAALLRLGSDFGLGPPLPVPLRTPALKRDGRIGWRPTIGLRLVNVSF